MAEEGVAEDGKADKDDYEDEHKLARERQQGGWEDKRRVIGKESGSQKC